MNGLQLKFNIINCMLHLGKPHEFGEYMIDGAFIRCCNGVRDLGVHIDSQLRFNDHTTIVTKKANCFVAIIWKAFQLFDKNTFTNLYRTYV